MKAVSEASGAPEHAALRAADEVCTRMRQIVQRRLGRYMEARADEHLAEVARALADAKWCAAVGLDEQSARAFGMAYWHRDAAEECAQSALRCLGPSETSS